MRKKKQPSFFWFSLLSLLPQKEKDLELTARIGKELLATNQKLENTVAALDSELKTANENITQLHYELSQKNDLLTILTNDAQESEDETGNFIF